MDRQAFLALRKEILSEKSDRKMPIINFKYGRRLEQVEIPEKNFLGSLQPQEVRPAEDPTGEIRRALDQPIGCGPLAQRVQKGEQVAVIISDITRPCPSYLLLPPLLAELNQAGIPDRDITVVCGLGIHRPHRPEELRHLVGEVYDRVRCLDACGDDYLEVGSSSRGTPFQVFRPVAEADRRICLGNIDYHYFAGYSGGAKAIVPGVCTKATIQANHRMMLDEGARVGIADGNPVRQDLEEIVRFLSIDFILNVVLDEGKRIIAAVAGDFIAAHRAGCRLLDRDYRMPIRELADIVISGANGFPKDINMYQAQKALDNAQWAVKPGGTIILVAECGEGLGEETFQAWIENASGPHDLIARIKADFQLGGHKAAAIAAIAARHSIYLVSGLPHEVVRQMAMQPFPTLQAACQAALDQQGPQAKVWTMPAGGSLLPVLA